MTAGIKHAGRGYGPRIHDIRHTHCCHVLQAASYNKTDLTNMLPALSVYMGHESVAATSQYLKMTAEIYPDIILNIKEYTDSKCEHPFTAVSTAGDGTLSTGEDGYARSEDFGQE